MRPEFEVAKELADFPVVLRWPVQWGDQDAFGHVNNTVYFRWFESSRISYGDALGLAAERSEQLEIGPILAHIGCNFRRQVKYPDHVQIGARVTRLGRSSFTMIHSLYSEAQGAIAAEGDSTIVVFNYRLQRPCAIPEDLRKKMAKLEGGSISA